MLFYSKENRNRLGFEEGNWSEVRGEKNKLSIAKAAIANESP